MPTNRSRTSVPFSKISSLLIGLAWIAMGSMACPTTLSEPDAGPAIPGTEGLQSCESVEDCPDQTNYDCLGICLQRCASDGACRQSEFCSPRGYCEKGCRDSSSCEADFVCVAGTCKDTESAGSCGSKCDCGTGQVCSSGVCQDPPDTCTGPDECGRGPADRCEAYQCNGFTNECFDPDPQPCSSAADCLGRPGCQSGCACTPAGQCVPDVACQVATEEADCGTGFYCNDDLACDVLPTCASANDCPSSLACNVGTSTCQRPRPCTSSAECSAPPATFCNTALATPRCDVPSCLNGGVTCNATSEDCAQDGRCVPQGTGMACMSDANCPNAAWPNTQYCEFGSGQGQCAIGCRSNASCSTGQICNGARQCVADGGGGGGGGAGNGQWGATCTDDSECLAGLICGTFTGTCAEPCEATGTDCAGDPSCCPLSGAARCNFVGFCAN